MRRFFRDLRIKSKLILLLSMSAFVALFISFSIMSVYSIRKDIDWSVRATSNLAAVSAKNIIAALTFLDKEAVRSILLPTLNDEDILSLKVYDAKRELFVDVAKKDTQHSSKQKLLFLGQKSESTTFTAIL